MERHQVAEAVSSAAREDFANRIGGRVRSLSKGGRTATGGLGVVLVAGVVAEESVTPGEWIDAFCLAILTDKTDWHGEAFYFARRKFEEEAQGSSAGELATGFSWTPALRTDYRPTPSSQASRAGARGSAASAASGVMFERYTREAFIPADGQPSSPGDS
ncbi:hypothetical protein ABZ128_28055 [Streptomyces sp. NPDC006326]|uniref:hypothetical protein n=1 Tax=Streptomyces sp. NPDC006326 TaxID=3156752 RepID=UPI00339DD028